MKKLLLIFLFLIEINTLNAQQENHKWQAVSVLYTINHQSETSKNAEQGFLGLLHRNYKFFISDLDGDNCPFYPSCSGFFVESVKRTNFLQGSLLFIDRFTRDMNFFKSFDQYPIHKSGKFFDPISNYIDGNFTPSY